MHPTVLLFALIIFVVVGSKIGKSYLLYRLAKTMRHANPWWAFVPLVHFLLVVDLGELKPANRWWVGASFIPGVNIIAILVMLLLSVSGYIRISKKCGEHSHFGLLTTLPVIQLWAMWRLSEQAKNVSQDPKTQTILKTVHTLRAQGQSDDSITAMMVAAGITSETIHFALESKREASVGPQKRISALPVRTIWHIFIGYLMILGIIVSIFINTRPELNLSLIPPEIAKELDLLQ